MKARNLVLLAASGLIALAARFVQVLTRAQPGEVPEKYRETVSKGLDYLVQQQFKDGHWEGDGGNHPVAMTGLVGLALLMERSNPSGRGKPAARREPKYAANVRKAAEWLMEKAQAGRDGLIFSGHASESSRYMQGHGLATLFLAGALENEMDGMRQKKLPAVLARAATYIVRAQSTQGGWYDTSKVEGHDFDAIQATVIQIQALQAADNAGIAVPNGVFHDAIEYLKKALEKYEHGATAKKDRNRPADTAAALASLVESNRFLPDGTATDTEIKDDLRKSAFRYCYSQTEIPLGRNIRFGRDDFAHYFYAQAEHNRGGDFWSGYRTTTFPQIQTSQKKDGSWPAGEGICAGPVFSTALWCIVLQLDNNSHPSMRPAAIEIE